MLQFFQFSTCRSAVFYEVISRDFGANRRTNGITSRFRKVAKRVIVVSRFLVISTGIKARELCCSRLMKRRLCSRTGFNNTVDIVIEYFPYPPRYLYNAIELENFIGANFLDPFVNLTVIRTIELPGFLIARLFRLRVFEIVPSHDAFPSFRAMQGYLGLSTNRS